MAGENESKWNPETISEEVNTRNVLAAIQHANDTRKMLRKAEDRVDFLVNEVTSLRSEVQNLTQQVGILRGEVYRGGATA